MEVVVERTIWIDEEEIAKSVLNGNFNDTLAAVDEYCAGLDDCDYYALDDEAYAEIERAVNKIVAHSAPLNFYLYCDEETGEEFIVNAVNQKDSLDIATEYFNKPNFISQITDEQSEMLGLDVY